jgi:maltose O-acetyltransferase
MKKIKYEFILWIQFVLKLIPGYVGISIRNFILPYKRGKNVKVWDFVHIDNPSQLIMGNNISINRGCVINADGGIVIWNDVLIGPNVTIYSVNHNFKNKSIPFSKQGYKKKYVSIGNNVWIASNAIILPGVEIGDNVVIAAGAIVTKKIPSDSMVMGINNVKKIF